jgi:hypothetical protein
MNGRNKKAVRCNQSPDGLIPPNNVKMMTKILFSYNKEPP